MTRTASHAEVSPSAPTALLVLKAPREGAVKTRLGREIGMREAVLVYRRLVERQLREIPPEWATHICFAPAEAGEEMRAWLGGRSAFSAQREGDLGARLTDAAARHFLQSGAPLVLLGGDCPGLTADRLQEVAEVLRTHHVVVVPAVDGGYCLLALRAPCANLFRDISWSTAAVLEQTRARIAESGLSCCELEALEDVDDAASWRRALAAFPELAHA